MKNIGLLFPALEKGPVKCTFINASKGHTTPIYAVRMSNEEYGEPLHQFPFLNGDVISTLPVSSNAH